MAYHMNISLKEVLVVYTDGENRGEYKFLLTANGQPTHEIITGDDTAWDGSVWTNVGYLNPPSLFPSYTFDDDNQKVRLKMESWESDGGFRFGDGYGFVEADVGFRDNGIVYRDIHDDDGNHVQFRVSVTTWPVAPTPETVPNLNGVILYEDWKYNVDSPRGSILTRPRAQRFEPGEYNLPYQTPFNINGRPGLRLGVRPNSVSSLKIGSGYYLELFDEKDWTGQSITVNENKWVMPDGWNDRVKSFRVLLYPLPR
jgi:hypothetical protein